MHPSSSYRSFVKSIDPINGAKYSKNLYLWITSMEWSLFEIHKLFKDASNDFWIGYCDSNMWFYGLRLESVLANASAQHIAYPGKAYNLTVVPDFWRLYLQSGVCVVDLMHLQDQLGGQQRFEGVGVNSRTCVWCGQLQVKLACSETVRKVRWCSP